MKKAIVTVVALPVLSAVALGFGLSYAGHIHETAYSTTTSQTALQPDPD
jgi:hypothetical protein